MPSATCTAATPLHTLINAIAPAAADTLVFLGDLIDRGPDTKRVLDMVLDLYRRCRVVVILGNHEEMMLNALNGLDMRAWLLFGGREALDSYDGSVRNIPQRHIDLMQSALDDWETASTIYIHANLQSGVPLNEQDGVISAGRISPARNSRSIAIGASSADTRRNPAAIRS